LTGTERVVQALDPGLRFDATLILDCGDARLLGDGFPARAVTGPLIVVDHHSYGGDYGDLMVRDPEAAAVGVLVARLLGRLGVALERPIAEALWCSLVSDTGWFRYSSTNLEVMKLATACVAAGAVPWEFARLSEEEAPAVRLRLLARVLSSLELFGKPPRQVAVLTVSDAMVSEVGASLADAEGFVNYARGLEGVEVGALFTVRGGEVRVSLRSKGAIDVGRAAALFGGGGHLAAAGATFRGDLGEFHRRLLEVLLEVGR
jgi:phosphoesterase RecJ-like protein